MLIFVGKTFLINILLVSFYIKCFGNEYLYEFSGDYFEELKNQTKAVFKHAWKSYLNHGFPYDEVYPITCKPRGPNFNLMDNSGRNDVLGGISITMLDNLDTLIIMEEWDDLEKMLEYLKKKKDFFNVDTNVLVFEITIRALGGLLSTHLLLSDLTFNKTVSRSQMKLKKISDNYDGFLLKLAHDLGSRLIKAYKTVNHIPVPRVNLSNGVKKVPFQNQQFISTAEAVTPYLEFKLLSKLTGDFQFEYYTQLTFWKLWSMRLSLNLLSMNIDVFNAQWTNNISGNGASIDSFYEYAAKSYILFNDLHSWQVFKESYKSLLIFLAKGGTSFLKPLIYTNINVHDGNIKNNWIDLLSGFWPGLQVITGQVSDAINTHFLYLKIWDYFNLIPERWSYNNLNNEESNIDNAIVLEWYPLRPEFIESTYYLYRATRDPMYLNIGEKILKTFQSKHMAKCGLKGYKNIKTGEFEDKMESFVLSETLKYLYLLFDVNSKSILHSELMNEKNWVMSTEGHPLWYNENIKKKNFSYNFNKTNSDLQKKKKLNEYSFYKNIKLTNSEVLDFNFFENKTSIKLVEFNDNRFNHCEIKFLDVNKGLNYFFHSFFYTWNQLFSLDYILISLVRPDHLSKSFLDDSYIELSKKFYDRFSLHSRTIKNSLQTARLPTTKYFQYNIGIQKNILTQSIFKFLILKDGNLDPEVSIKNDDLWIHNVTSFYMKVEKLELNQIDSRNELITQDYINNVKNSNCNFYLDCKKNNVHNFFDIFFDPKVKNEQAILRISKINGIALSLDQNIWFLIPTVKSLSYKENNFFDVTSNGKLVLNGLIVENFKILKKK